MNSRTPLVREAPFLRCLVVVWLAVAGCDAAPQRSSPPPAVTPNPPVPRPEPPSVAEHLNEAPRRCPGPELKRGEVSRFYAPLVGDGLAHAGLYARYDAPDGFHAPDAPRTRFGFRIKALWVMRASQEARVSVSGHGQPGIDLWFQDAEDGRRPTTELVLDPGSIAMSFEHPRWKELHTYLYFPEAGCYRLEVRGAGESWTAAVGLGR
jgi:hypothetical protein